MEKQKTHDDNSTITKSTPQDTTSKKIHIESSTRFIPNSSTSLTPSLLPTSHYTKKATTATMLKSTTFSYTTVQPSSLSSVTSAAYSTAILITHPIQTTISTPKNHNTNFLYYVIPAAVVAFILLVIFLILLGRRYKKKQQLQKEFTPCYTYDQSENEITDGVLYPSESNSVDLLCVDASPVVGRHGTHQVIDDNDTSCLLGSYNTRNNNELNDVASDVRHDSVAV